MQRLPTIRFIDWFEFARKIKERNMVTATTAVSTDTVATAATAATAATRQLFMATNKWPHARACAL